jgi:hypothetical protein
MFKRVAGPTAALGARNALEWWRVHVGVPIPTNEPALDCFKQIEKGHVVSDGTTPEPWMIVALLQLAHAGRGPISILAGLFACFASTCMRWRHIQRSALIETTTTAFIFKCRLGKVARKGARSPFLSPAPRRWNQGLDLADLLGSFWKEHKENFGPDYVDKSFLVPNIEFEKCKGVAIMLSSESTWIWDKAMPYGKATNILRALLVEVGASEEMAKEITLKSLRKFLPTAADTFQMDDEDKHALGDWQDNPGKKGKSGPSSGSMPRTYSGANLQTAFSAKQWIVSGLATIAATAGDLACQNLNRWFTWSYVATRRFAYRGFYENLMKAAGGDATLGSIVNYELSESHTNRALARSKSVSSPPKRQRFNSPLPERTLFQEGDSASATDQPADDGFGVSELPPFDESLAEGPLPPAPEDKSGAHDSSSSDSESSDDGAEDPLKAAEQTLWFSQMRSNTAHFYRDLDDAGRPIPLCRCKSLKGFKRDTELEHHGKGHVLLHTMGKKIHNLCCRKVSDEVACLFEHPPT